MSIGKKKVGARKSVEDIFVDTPFFNRKHHENGHLELFPYKSWYNDNLSCVLHWLSVKCTSLASGRSCDFSLTSFVKKHNQYITHDKLYQITC